MLPMLETLTTLLLPWSELYADSAWIPTTILAVHVLALFAGGGIVADTGWTAGRAKSVAAHPESRKLCFTSDRFTQHHTRPSEAPLRHFRQLLGLIYSLFSWILMSPARAMPRVSFFAGWICFRMPRWFWRFSSDSLTEHVGHW